MTLTREERWAFIAWFSGGKSTVIQYGDDPNVFWGKAECEIDFNRVWLGKFRRLELFDIVEIDRYRAVGKIGTPEAVKYSVEPTEKGWALLGFLRYGQYGGAT